MAFKATNNTFADLAVIDRLKSVNSFLKEIESIVDFDKLKPILSKNGIGNKSAVGVKAYPNTTMFKILMLQKFYNLSDKAVEESLYTNLLFMSFTGISLEDNVPDDTTICRFRNSLIDNQLHDKLFININKQLSEQGLIVNTGKAILIDATLIKSENNKVKNKSKDIRTEDNLKTDDLNKELDIEIEQELAKDSPSSKKVTRLIKKKEYHSKTLKNKELDQMQGIDSKDIAVSQKIIMQNEDSYDQDNKIDQEVRTGYQAGKKEYATGYKAHIAVDEKSGAILKPTVTFANTSDISTVEGFIESIKGIESLYADKAYKSEKIDQLLETKGITNNICKKETKNMSKQNRTEQREAEKPKHKVRSKVEHGFARIKREMKGHTTRFTGLVRNSMNFTITCIAANLKLFAHQQQRLER